MEEYIKMVNKYDKKREEKWYLTEKLSDSHDKDKKTIKGFTKENRYIKKTK